MHRSRKLSVWDIGRTPLYACQYDQRFSYCLYVPDDYAPEGDKVYSLVVLVHGTERDVQSYRDSFEDFGRANDCIVLAPLFPAGIPDPGELDGYKYLEHRGIRFDEILLSMVEEISACYRVEGARFLLFGYSGGGQFAHRFVYLYPERVRAASIGAPGAVTLLDEDLPWPAGFAGAEAALGRNVDPAALSGTAMHLVIGADDTGTQTNSVPAGHPAWIPGVNDEGVPRTTRLRALRRSLERHGIPVRYDVVPGVGHYGPGVVSKVKDFFTHVLTVDAERTTSNTG
ncbi:hypothetical protein ACIBKY_43485 [Nonomuraea sp. NPDC050394]|uniref:hypothetical protein n=1 Tax=Nonomuraea sp. NPDC050394 TaxID=3364363 RepID=UPI0037AC33A5